MNKKEQHIIEQAYLLLKNELGNDIEWEKTATGQYDAKFKLQNRIIHVEARNEVRPNQIGPFIRDKEQVKFLLVVANYITPNAQKLLKEKDINYVDRAGNIRLKVPRVYIYIEGKANQPVTEDRKNRAFTKTGTKVVFELLLDPVLLNTTYRDLAQKTGVALGTIPKVMEGLKEEKYLARKNQNEWIYQDYPDLVNRWQQEYIRRLKPTLFVKRYRPTDKNFHNNWRKLKLKHNAVWGGEPAADILTNYLKPENFTIYTNQTQQEIMTTYRWIPDEEGEIFVYKKFWNFPANDQAIAPPLLVYADLMGTADSRCIDTAHMIYEQELQKY